MFPTQMDDRACRAMACDLEEPEAPQKPKAGPSWAEREAALIADRERLLGELAALKGKHSQELLAVQEQLADAVEAGNPAREQALAARLNAPLPPADPNMPIRNDLDGLVLGGPCHGERWRCTGRVMVVPRFDGPDSRYVLQSLYTVRGKVECWLLDGGDPVIHILRLAARPNAEPEPRGRALTQALADMYATGQGMVRMTATEVAQAERDAFALGRDCEAKPEPRNVPMVEDPPRKRLRPMRPTVEKGAVRIECEHGYDHCPKCDDDGA